jgi:hypothetical protein
LKTDTSKAKITNININYSGRPGILGDANEKDLFDIAKKNGCLSLSYSQFSKHVGSYIALNFGEEIPLAEGEASGSSGNPQLSFVVKFKSVDGVARTYQLNTAIIYDGTCVIIREGNAVKQLVVLSTNDVIESVKNGYDTVELSAYENNKYGGSSLAILGALASLKPGTQFVRGLVQKAAPIVKGVADFSERIELGSNFLQGDKLMAGSISGGVTAKKKVSRPKKGRIYGWRSDN